MDFKNIETTKGLLPTFWSTFFFLTLLTSCGSKSNQAVPDTQSQAVLQRLIGDSSKDFTMLLVNHGHQQNSEWFSVTSTKNKVIVKGSSSTALCYGAYSFLKDIGAVQVSWEGSRIDLPGSWPDYKAEESTPFRFRNYLNVCAYGYTTPWWDWERWSQEIDFMALHGINMPTAMEGQEIVWQKLWREYGLTQEQLSHHFAGPAFLPWQRMGNINAHGGPLPQEWIDKKYHLQKKILKRMRNLGMHPVLPAFNGYVPKAFAEAHPNSKISELSGWSGGGFASTYLLDPKDPLFKEIGKRFIGLYNELYGAGHYYLADSFNEIEPPVSEEHKNEELSQYGSIIYETINESVPGATWVLQGWLFGNDKDYWTEDATKAFLSKVPDEKVLIQDFANDRYKVWELQHAFYGKQWTYGYVHNYGGSNPVYGDLGFYRKELNDLLVNSNKGKLVGYGVMPEGLNNNSIVYEYIYDLPWSQGDQPVQEWLKGYLKARYGKINKPVLEAWEHIIQSVYSTKYWTTRWWDGKAGAYFFFKRPTLKISTFEGNPGDKKTLGKAMTILKKEMENYRESTLFQYDLIDMERHYNSLVIDELLVNCVQAYQDKNLEKADVLADEIKHLVFHTDSIISKQPLNRLDNWLNAAKNYAVSEPASELYTKNAKMLITLWGGNGNLNDYASRAWNGSYKEFYWPRWKMFLQALREATNENQAFNESMEIQRIKDWEVKWSENSKSSN